MHSRCNTRSVVITVRGDQSFNLNALVWSSDEETTKFFPMVAKYDLAQLSTELEGYSIAGGLTSGAAKSYKAMVNKLASDASTLILDGLSTFRSLFFLSFLV